MTGPALAPGSYRVYADFVPTGHDGMTLATDLAVAGSFTPQPLPAPGTTDAVDGYDVSDRGRAGRWCRLDDHRDRAVAMVSRSPTCSRTSAPSATWSPSATVTSPTSTCTRSIPSTVPVARPSGSPSTSPPPARYGLFFDFSHGGSVHTASVIAAATAAAAAAPADDHHAD